MRSRASVLICLSRSLLTSGVFGSEKNESYYIGKFTDSFTENLYRNMKTEVTETFKHAKKLYTWRWYKKYIQFILVTISFHKSITQNIIFYTTLIQFQLASICRFFWNSPLKINFRLSSRHCKKFETLKIFISGDERENHWKPSQAIWPTHMDCFAENSQLKLFY